MNSVVPLNAPQSYAHIDSLALIRPPYPAQGSADWWALRKRVEELIARDSRKRGTTYTEAQFRRSEGARLCALGDEDGERTWQRNGFTAEQWIKKWNPMRKGRHITDELAASLVREIR